jgi:protein-L-isoaspartate(D-aspartate) O-methyltransferase
MNKIHRENQPMDRTEAHRHFYARFVVRSAGSSDERLIAAFANVPREHYVGPGPWNIFVGSGYLPTISAEPYLLYQDVLVGLAIDRGINNGQPSLHARCLAAVAPALGETVIHVGAGTGYYTAILANLVGPQGSIQAFEVEPALAALARENLRSMPWVEVIAGSAAEVSMGAADIIYVNAGVTHPPGAWLDSLKLGGRLILSLTPDRGLGCMLLVTKRGPASFAAAAIMRVAFIPCIGARDEATSKSIAVALERQSLNTVRSLRCDEKPDDTARCVGDGWWLSTAAPRATQEREG